jgi:hypothetical protein
LTGGQGIGLRTLISRRRTTAFRIAIVVVVLTPVLVGEPGPRPVIYEEALPASTSQPLLIKHGWDVPTPQFVRDHLSAMQGMPFDGMTVSVPGLGNRVQRQASVSLKRFRAALAPLRGLSLGSLAHSFAVVYATPAGDYFGDYTVPVENFARLAQAVREAGLAGIVYDNEEYFGPLSNYPQNCRGHSLDACRDQVLRRGQQVMDGMRARFPGIQVMALLGPWISDPRTETVLGQVLPYRDVASRHELMGSFIVGMVASAAGTSAKVIDGGEIYTARTVGQFAAIRSWARSGVASPSGIVPAGLRARWPGSVSVAFGVYDRQWMGAGMDVVSWGVTLRNALATTDEYVWAYTERYDWWGTGWPPARIPADWVAATRSARQSETRSVTPTRSVGPRLVPLP